MALTIKASGEPRQLTAADIAPVCPLCHTSHPTMTTAALMEGASWRCARCGQMWDAGRLQTVADYSRHTASH